MNLLERPNELGCQLLGQLKKLRDSAEFAYEKQGVTDVPSSLHRRLSDFQGWKTLTRIGTREDPIGSAAVVAIGSILGLALAGKKDIPNAYCYKVQKDLENSSLDVESLLSRPSSDPICNWHSAFYKFWLDFYGTFSSAPLEETDLPDIHRVIRGRWIGRSAFPSERLRAGILDSTCFSADQVHKALKHDGKGVFSSEVEYQFALWLIGTSGAPVEAAHQIPVWHSDQIAGLEDDWSICIDAEMMLLKRDYSSLSKGVATASKPGSEEASC